VRLRWEQAYTRREVLRAAVAGGLWPAGAVLAAPPKPEVLQTWVSGNHSLAPLAEMNGHILYSGDRTLGCIRPQQATPVWQVAHQLSGPAVYRPRAAGGSVVTGGLSELGAWRFSDGQRRWLHKAQIQVGTPCVTADCVYVGDGHALLALNVADGSILWRFAGTPDTLASYAPAVAGDTVFFGPGNGLLYAIHTTDGRLKWQLDQSHEWQYVRQMYVSGQVLVAGTYTELLYGIDINTGKIAWKFKAGNFINSHHVAGDTAYLWSPTGWVYAIDVHSGAVRWRHQTTRYGNRAANWGPMMAELLSFENKLYCLDMHQVLHVLDVSTGHEVERIQFGHDLRPTLLVLAQQQALVADVSGEIHRVRW
jgi:outer membrane protein assembly factor BamB